MGCQLLLFIWTVLYVSLASSTIKDDELVADSEILPLPDDSKWSDGAQEGSAALVEAPLVEVNGESSSRPEKTPYNVVSVPEIFLPDDPEFGPLEDEAFPAHND
jgi:hypothetical protein